MSKREKRTYAAVVVLIIALMAALMVVPAANAQATRTGRSRRVYTTPRATIVIPTARPRGRMSRWPWRSHATPAPRVTVIPRQTPEPDAEGPGEVNDCETLEECAGN